MSEPLTPEREAELRQLVCLNGALGFDACVVRELFREIDRLRKDNEKLSFDRPDPTLHAVNAVMREWGYGQGQLDDDLAGCVRELIDRLRAALAETVAGLEPFAVIGRTALWLRAEATKPPADIQPASLVDCEHAAELVARYKGASGSTGGG